MNNEANQGMWIDLTKTSKQNERGWRDRWRRNRTNHNVWHEGQCGCQICAAERQATPTINKWHCHEWPLAWVQFTHDLPADCYGFTTTIQSPQGTRAWYSGNLD